jgi:hypothetical protein
MAVEMIRTRSTRPGGDDLGLTDPGGPDGSWSTLARLLSVIVWRPVRSWPSSWEGGFGQPLAPAEVASAAIRDRIYI